MSLQLDHDTRAEMRQRLVVLQDEVLRASLGKRRIHDPHKWVFSFAARPREFLGEIIEDWEEYHWTAWRSFISAVFCQPFKSIGEERVFQQCTNLKEPPRQRPPSIWMPIGRRGGKSRILAAIAVHLGCCYDWAPYLDPGELGVVPVLAADRRQARTIMSYIKAFLTHRELADLVVTDSAESILLRGNVLIEVVTASFRAVRSRTVLAALCDEIAFWHSDESSLNPDTEIIAALEPAMATIPNALLLGASSPYARRGVLWNNFERYYGKDEGPLIWRAATRVMNPTISQAFIDQKYEEDPYSADAEYGANFRSDVDAFITREAIDGVTIRGLQEIPPIMGMRYWAFVDPSGGSVDPMTLAIAHIDPQSKRGILDVLRERRPPFSPDGVVGEFVNILREYRISRVVGDHYAGEWPRERFRARGVHYEVSKISKSDIYVAFLPIINAGRCELLDNTRLYNQLLGLDRRISRGGHESIDHGPGAHDDLANVCAGVMQVMLGKRATLAIDPGVLQRSATLYTRPSLDAMNGGPVWR
jgi:hypothetical protein